MTQLRCGRCVAALADGATRCQNCGADLAVIPPLRPPETHRTVDRLLGLLSGHVAPVDVKPPEDWAKHKG